MTVPFSFYSHIMNRKEVITIEKTVQMNSVTQAMRARDILKSSGIRSKVKRITSSDGHKPCSYGLTIYNDFDRAVEILRDKNFNFNGRAFGGRL